MHEYAFDVNLYGVIVVKAETEEDALDMIGTFESEDVDFLNRSGVKLTEVSVDINSPTIFQIDGVCEPVSYLFRPEWLQG